ncbi:DNA polymerase nu-like [Strongylocentrotus purpuratus]|uniref:DNA-directed DNA polymerase family A palm domain-containing protein n=1 Tax=Strongylocentrotus purpuratus TaxID=7668 RepID=A0A7M7PCD2_STRPU|nr:DNA polymerase nu-like [Strongylocentrotus purpuratus]
MSYCIDLNPKQTKQVWTPLKKPPHPGSVHILSDDALLVLAALREAHWKKIEDQQRRCQRSTDGRSYYTQIYAQSFKTEKVDAGPEDRTNLTNTKNDPGPGTVSQVDSSQPHAQLENFDGDFGNSGTTPTISIDLVSTVKTEPEGESLSSSKTHNFKDPDEQSGKNRFQLQMLPNQVQRKHEIIVHHQQTKGSDDCKLRPGPSKSDAHSSKLTACLSSHPPTISRYLPSLQNVIGDASQGLRISTRTHSLQVSRSQSAEDVEELEGHPTLPMSRTVPSKQNTIGVNSGGSGIFSGAQPLLVSRCLLSTEDVEELEGHATLPISRTVSSICIKQNTIGVNSGGSGIFSGAQPHLVSRCSLSSEDVEEPDGHRVIPSVSKTTPPLQNMPGFVDRSLSQGSRTSLRTCHIPVASDLSSAEDTEGLDDPAAVRDRQQNLSISSKMVTFNTASECPKETIALKLARTEKSLPENQNSVSKGSSSVDVKQLSTHAGSRGRTHHRQTPKPSKRGNICSIGSTSSDAPTAVKKRVIPTFHRTASGLKEKPKNKTGTLSQMSIEQVMGTNRISGAPVPAKTITSMSPSELAKLQEIVSESSEMLMMLTYTDGSTQLREPNEPRKRALSSLHEDGVANSVLVAVQRKAAKKEYMFVSFPLAGLHVGKENASEATRNVLLEILQSNTRKVCFDAQELMHAIIINYRLDPQSGCNKWVIMDPKIACWLLDPDNPPVTFSGMLKTFLAGKYNDQTPNNHLAHLELLGPVIGDLTNKLQRKNLWELFINLEVPLIPILDEIKDVERQCYKKAGHPFQITSHIQLRQVLFDELKLDELCPGQKLARTNVQNLKSTSEMVLHKLKDLHPLPELVLTHRQLVKLKSTYLDGLSDYVSGGYIHTSWDQTSAASGRLQSSNPNIQNIPKQPLQVHKDANGSVVNESTVSSTAPATTLWMREPFFSHEGWSFIAADFQSIELRILAHLSQDAVLLKVFNDAGSTDIFVQLTCEWLGLNLEDVKTGDRERTKRIVYSVIYGVGAERLAETLNDTKENAKAFTKSFLVKFKGVNTFAQRCISECQRHGHVKTIFHRHRLISNISSQNFHVRSHAERQAVNFVIQGSAADICKLAMIHIMTVLSERNTVRARLLVQIHDELLFEVHDEDINEVKDILKTVMESTPTLGESICQLKVPLPVSLSYGKTWGHLKQVV